MSDRALVVRLRLVVLRAAIAAIVLCLFGAPARLAAQATADSGIACGFDLSGPVYAKWREMLGETGRLGCPSTKEIETLKTPFGTGGRIGTFVGRDKLGAAILWHASGPHAGQTIAVYGCAYRLYMQYGGPSGWLGLPTGDPVNTPDGQVQSFEGGAITMLRAENRCVAARSAEAPPQVAAADASGKAALDLFFDPARGDYLTTATIAGVEAARAAHYERVRNEAFVFTENGPGLAPLKLYWNEMRGDNATVGTAEGERQLLAAGYEFGGTQGFVYLDPQSGAKPLKLYWNAEREDFLLTATSEGEADAAANGYRFVRIEGYAPTNP